MTAQLLGSAALLTVYAEPGQSWTEADRTMLGQLAALISAPINDARRLQAAEHTAELGRLLGGVMEPHDVIARFCSDGVALLEADVVMLVGERLEDGGDQPLDKLPADVLDAIDAVADGGGPRYLTDRPATSPMVWAVLPVVSTGDRYGVLAAGFDDAQPFDEVQQSFLRDLIGPAGVGARPEPRLRQRAERPARGGAGLGPLARPPGAGGRARPGVDPPPRRPGPAAPRPRRRTRRQRDGGHLLDPTARRGARRLARPAHRCRRNTPIVWWRCSPTTSPAAPARGSATSTSPNCRASSAPTSRPTASPRSPACRSWSAPARWGCSCSLDAGRRPARRRPTASCSVRRWRWPARRCSGPPATTPSTPSRTRCSAACWSCPPSRSTACAGRCSTAPGAPASPAATGTT